MILADHLVHVWLSTKCFTYGFMLIITKKLPKESARESMLYGLLKTHPINQ